MGVTSTPISLGPTGNTCRENFTRYRLAAGLSYAELSRRMTELGRGIPPLGLRRIEAGERRVDVDDLLVLAVALDVTPNALLFPDVRGTEVIRDVTGTGLVTTDALWDWAYGQSPLPGRDGPRDLGDRLKFHARTRPRQMLTDAERFALRESWVQRRLAELKGQADRAADNPVTEGLDLFLSRITAQQDQVRQLDPADDGAWAAHPDLDPAPPATAAHRG